MLAQAQAQPQPASVSHSHAGSRSLSPASDPLTATTSTSISPSHSLHSMLTVQRFGDHSFGHTIANGQPQPQPHSQHLGPPPGFPAKMLHINHPAQHLAANSAESGGPGPASPTNSIHSHPSQHDHLQHHLGANGPAPINPQQQPASAAPSNVVPPTTTAPIVEGPIVPVDEQVFTHGLVGGQWADAVLCVSAPNFAKVYPCHSLLLARVPYFRERLLALRSLPAGALLPPLGMLPTNPATMLNLPDEQSLAGLGFVRGRDYLYRIDVFLPELASDDAMGMILSYVYNSKLPESLSPSLSVAVLTVASALGLAPIVQHVANLINQSLSLDTLADFLPLLNTSLSPVITAFLASALTTLPTPILGLASTQGVPMSGSPTDPAYIKLVDTFSQLPWHLLKSLIEDTADLGGSGPASQHMRPYLEHGRFEFAKRVLSARGNPDETAVVAFGNGPSGVLLVRRADRKIRRKMWKVEP